MQKSNMYQPYGCEKATRYQNLMDEKKRGVETSGIKKKGFKTSWIRKIRCRNLMDEQKRGVE